MILLLSQTEAIVEGASQVLTGKTEMFLSALVIVVFVAWTMFQQSKDRKESALNHERREAEDKVRYDAQNQFHRDMAVRNADQLDLMATSLERTSKATEVMANCSERIDLQLNGLTAAQRRDRRALVSVIDASEAKSRGEDEAAIASIKEARNHLITGEE